MAKIRYNRDGTHSFIGVPVIESKLMNWCPLGRHFKGSRFKKQIGNIYRMFCTVCGCYEIRIMPGQKVILYDLKRDFYLPVYPVVLGKYRKMEYINGLRVISFVIGRRVNRWVRCPLGAGWVWRPYEYRFA